MDKIPIRVITQSLRTISSLLDDFPAERSYPIQDGYFIYVWKEEPVWNASLMNNSDCIENTHIDWFRNIQYGTGLRTPVPVFKKALLMLADILELNLFPVKEDQWIPIDGFLVNLHPGENGYQEVRIHKRDENGKIVWDPFHLIFQYNPTGLKLFNES